ncbi:hydrophobe/amphiphile efflux-1 family RND transporter [Phenylobacterium hankyongense]|uniref:Efflux pump membrane transporter n=1 Tax=Phenylobacterium hankyongense TaxID=1813876 RepID=A0A328AVU1_9CAUL|nr:multidrug efflux RND transporter permease subunit [Phenylobacterium hankyongense]RAK58729.1 hydrophobe/amphiphile efflux-1 family RND transporter [Phenylobacterium hankyongense]
MFSGIFIKRPIFAWVIAIIIMLAGAGAIMGLPVAQYPDIAPPQVSIQATYPGASASTIQNSVTQIIEQSLTGIDGMLYFSSSSSSRGQVTITATFAKGVNPDIAQVQVQNQVAQTVSRLPAQVQQQGLVVRKSNPDNLLIITVYDETDRMTNRDVSDYLVANLQDPISRLQGVGNTNVFGAQYAMRIWLNPDKLASYQLMPSDVVTAIQNQNAEVAAGELGAQPQPATQMLDATVTAQSQLQTPEQFAKIVVKGQPGGGAVLLSDVARVELGSENYNTSSRVNRHPGAGLAILLAPGADALKTATLVKARVAELSGVLPPGLKVAYANDTTNFIKLSISEVVKTLLEAIVLVVVVMFVFLQSWRATLVPAIAVPVVLLGTFGVLYLAGFSINTMTLFGLVLSIGLLVDDAIVVVENVERLMEENPELTPREATIASMREITMALVAIAIVLSAVFLPMAFFGGSTGVIYRQFSLTIISAMALSAFVALTLSPALTANLLKQKRAAHEVHESWLGRRLPAVASALHAAASRFNRDFERMADNYRRGVRWILGRKGVFVLIYGGVVVLLAVLFLRLPTGFLPTEDQGALSLQFQLPAGAIQSRTIEVQRQIETYFHDHEGKNIVTMFTVTGGGGTTGGQNTGQGFLNLVDWSQRKGAANSADGIVARASAAFKNIRDARVFVLSPASIRGLGNSSGFTLELQNASGMSQADFGAARDKLLALARQDPALASVRLTELPDIATLKVTTDARKLAALGVSQSDVNATLSTAWGGRYVNDFLDRGRVKRVYVQGDAPYRAQPSNLDEWYVRGSSGQMAPFSSFATSSWSVAPTTLSRFNGIPSYEFQGTPGPGGSSGQAMAEIQRLASQIPGTTFAWSGLSFQERLSSGQAPILYALSLLVVFLCLAALYESWSIPLAVLLVVPLGLVGAVLAVTLRGLINDVYLQIGLLTTMGLAAKNAILIVEFAEQAERRGRPVLEAAIEAARIRLRPILMTSLAFVFGVLPLAVSTGAGANSRIAIGTAVIGGMLTATVLAVFYVPLFFVLVRQGLRGGLRTLRGGHEAPPSEPPPSPEPA